MAKKKVTIDDLAVMVQKGFQEIRSEMATKADILNLEKRFDNLEERLEKVEERLDRIENIILTDYRNRLEKLEDKIRILETAKGR
ncbi:hypothetical protein KW783_01225 [Candidatus Parcubacteria bacterium]|nr:hypothetical protein [Candidatus Parcubacteria bacterium]